MGARELRFLMVGDAFPWPPTTGSHLRMANTIRALSEMGKVDLFCFYDARQAQESVPPEFAISRICMVPLGPSGDTPARRLVSLARRDLPLEVAFRNGNQNPRHVFDSWRASSYDLVWLSSATSYQWLGRPRLGPDRGGRLRSRGREGAPTGGPHREAAGPRRRRSSSACGGGGPGQDQCCGLVQVSAIGRVRGRPGRAGFRDGCPTVRR